MKITGSQTEKNLLAAFAGESQARNRYDYSAGQAKKDGFVQIAQVFEETAGQEKEHAKRFFKFLEGGEVRIEAVFPAGLIGTTGENLLAAAKGENEEWTTLYPGFAEVARSEGFKAVATVFEMVCIAEKQHERRYRGLLANIEADSVFEKPEPVIWRCLNCGFIHEGPEAPAACAACAHPRGYFELLAENW